MAKDAKYGLYVIPNESKTTTEPEPIFIIRGKDSTAPKALLTYAANALEMGADTTLVRDVVIRALEIAEWQKANPEVVKLPD